MSQCQTILKHLRHSSLTSMQAFQEYGITRLAARILDLRGYGHDIKTTILHKNGKNFAVYSIKEKAQLSLAGL